MTQSLGTEPPSELDTIMSAHLAKIRPHIEARASAQDKAVFTLYIQGARTDETGAVVATGQGTLMGPIDTSTPEKRQLLYALVRMPDLPPRVEDPAAGIILVVNCQIAQAGADDVVHQAILGLPAPSPHPKSEP